MFDPASQCILLVDSNSAIHEDFHNLLNSLNNDEKKDLALSRTKQKNKQSQPSYRLDSAYDSDQTLQFIQQSIENEHPYLIAFIDLYQNANESRIELIQRLWEIDPHLQIVLSIAFTPYSYQDIATILQRSDHFYILNKPYEANEIRQLILHLFMQQELDHAIAQNIKGLENKIHYQYTHDGLTDLGNRLFLSKHAQFVIAQAAQSRTLLGVAVLAIDNLKEIKTLFGFSVADNFINQIAKKLRQLCLQTDTLIRFSSEEFLIVLSNQENAANIENKMNQIEADFLRPLEVDNHMLVVSMRIGVSIYPRDGNELETLLKHAQAALFYSNKPTIKSIQFYNQTEHDVQLRRAELIMTLPLALKYNQFILHYQPLIKSDSSKILGVEALIRWQHPSLGLLYPQEFISLAEEIGQICAIDEWVLKTAVANVKKWQETIYPELLLAVNVSSYQICQPNFEFLVQKTLKQLEFDAHYLEFDMTANPLLIEDPDTIPKMNRLKESGIRFSLDNFGVGYANLDYLQFFPFDKVKIEKSFVNNIQLNVKQNKVIEAIIYFAKKMGVKVVAGGVETPEQVEFLFNHHGEEMQGFYFCPPLNEEVCSVFLKKQGAIVKEEG